MEDESAQVIWRCQYRPESQIRTYLKAAFSRKNTGTPYEPKKDLKVLFECRPYELGWLLYAFATKTGQVVPAVGENSIAAPQGVLAGKR
jgi:hypothetical protein